MPDRVLLTGISGFIARHVALRLLQEGFDVRGTVRSAAKADGVREALEKAGGDVSRLEFVEVDLTKDAGWTDAAQGCRYVVHTASPFPASQSRDKFALVPVAKGGTLRVVEAARRAGVDRIVLTSSVVAIYYGHDDRADASFSETDWSNVKSRTISDYAVSKTEAERAAWAAVTEAGEGGAPGLAVINPAFVLGPLLGDDIGTSAKIVAMMMKGKLPAVPDVSFGIVDVRDVAEAHLRAMTMPGAAGRRFILSADTLSILGIGRAIAEAEPSVAGKVPKFVLPDAVVKFVALFSSQARRSVPELGRIKTLDTRPARDVLGLTFRPPEQAVAAMAKSLRETGRVR